MIMQYKQLYPLMFYFSLFILDYVYVLVVFPLLYIVPTIIVFNVGIYICVTI